MHLLWIIIPPPLDPCFIVISVTTQSHEDGEWLQCAYPVNSGICSRRSGDSSSPSSCPFDTCNCWGCSASWPRWRCGTRPAPPDRWPRWSCSPCRPRTASSSGTWCCSCTPSDTVHWPLRSPGARAARTSRRPPSRWTLSLGVNKKRGRRWALPMGNIVHQLYAAIRQRTWFRWGIPLLVPQWGIFNWRVLYWIVAK